MSEKEDSYHDTIIDLKDKLKKNVELILKLGNSLQGMFLLRPKPSSVYDQQLKHGLGYSNPYTLKLAITHCPKLYLASRLGNSKILLNIRDNEDTLNDASKSQQKMKEKMDDPIVVVQIVLWIVDIGCLKHMTGDRSLLRNFIEKFVGIVRFINDNFTAITCYGDYIQGNITIFHVYYVEGLAHNLFSVGQFCDGDLEVAFRFKTCYIQNLEGDDLLTGGREYNLYTISISDMVASLPVCLILDLVDGLPKFKYEKNHLCSACERGKSKKASHPPKLVLSDNSKLELLHMDLCGLMRVASINRKKYILVIVDDYSRYTWVYSLHSKDETLEIIKKFIAQAQLNYKAKIYKIRTDNDTKFKNTNLKAYYEKLGIMHKFSAARTPQQNGVVERLMTRQRLHTDSEACMYALTVSTIEPKNIKEAMADHIWIESMQDELNQFKRLQKHGLDECVSMSTPMATERLDADSLGTPTDQTTYRRMIGGLMYLTASRPDIAYATFDSGFKLITYLDADHAGCKDNCKSTSGGLEFLGGKLVSWSLKKQDCTAMSTAEAEYVFLSACCAQVIWLRTQLLDYGYKFNRIPMYCDSKSAIAILCNPVQHSKTKHNDIRIAASSSVPWIYMAQFLHTLKEDGSKYRLKFMLDRKELSLTLDDFRTIFHLPQATNNNHDSFVTPPSFYDMIPFYKNHLGFTMELKTPSSFKTTSLLQPAIMGRNSLFSSSFNILDSLSKIYEDHYWSLHD
uniref:Retrotransposon protein, putative, Ty1-copia subclass n=1 Tax=Tanacetum cinerariifolium TaxID=118510 RepID=A0A6L2LRS2_TANCI|nr:retrotransposon protein, putative, Ty1-copia subclass [Tanacetum cinerariifolium]